LTVQGENSYAHRQLKPVVNFGGEPVDFAEAEVGGGAVAKAGQNGVTTTNCGMPSRFIAYVCLLGIAFTAGALRGAESPAPPKPVLLYSRYYNAEGETRYLPDGTFKEVLRRLRGPFEVRVDREPLTERNLADVRLLLLANPSDTAVEGHPAPPHISASDIPMLSGFVRRGGAILVMGNQENHNLEIRELNGLLRQFGLEFTNVYTDAKQLVLPDSAPVLGGLRWAYYTGNQIILHPEHAARPRALVQNDLRQPPLQGKRDADGTLLATAELGRGRVAVVTDSGWITDDALSGKGIGGVSIREHDNWEILLRLTRWLARTDAR
jgi:hypothetical protein